MRPPMLAGPIDRQVKFLRIGSSTGWTGGAAGATGAWNPWACMPAHAERAQDGRRQSRAEAQTRRSLDCTRRLLARQDLLPRAGVYYFLKSTFGAACADGGASKYGYSLKPNILAVRLRGELAARRVVVLHPLVVAHARDGQAVLGARELVHQAVELLVGLEVRIVLDHGEQAAERGAICWLAACDRFLGRLAPRAALERASAMSLKTVSSCVA